MKPLSERMLYQHRDGGIYEVLMTSKSSTDQSQWVVYEHLWPFEVATWHRPKAEFFDGRFKSISSDEVESIMVGDRQVYQAQVAAAKTARKGG